MPSGVYKRTEEYKKTLFKKGQLPWNTGKHHSAETIKKLKEKWIGRKHILTEKGKKSFHEKMSGKNNPKWVEDRTKLVKSEKKSIE